MMLSERNVMPWRMRSSFMLRTAASISILWTRMFLILTLTPNSVFCIFAYLTSSVFSTFCQIHESEHQSARVWIFGFIIIFYFQLLSQFDIAAIGSIDFIVCCCVFYFSIILLPSFDDNKMPIGAWKWCNKNAIINFI